MTDQQTIDHDNLSDCNVSEKSVISDSDNSSECDKLDVTKLSIQPIEKLIDGVVYCQCQGKFRDIKSARTAHCRTTKHVCFVKKLNNIGNDNTIPRRSREFNIVLQDLEVVQKTLEKAEDDMKRLCDEISDIELQLNRLAVTRISLLDKKDEFQKYIDLYRDKVKEETKRSQRIEKRLNREREYARERIGKIDYGKIFSEKSPEL